MALVNCGECKAQISDQAPSCPQCGFISKKTEVQSPKPKSKAGIYIIGALVVFGFIGMIGKDGNKNKEKTATEILNEIHGSPSVSASSTVYVPPPPEPGSQWRYSTSTDRLTNKKVYAAYVESSNLVNFDFPYNGPQRGTIYLRTHPKHGKDLIFSIEKGQLLCRSYDGCSVSVSFDSKDPVIYEAAGPDDHSTENLFIRNYSSFVGNMMKSKKVVIGVKVYQEGIQIFEFDVSDFSVEKYRPKQ